MGTSLLDIISFDDRSQKHPANSSLPDWLPKHEFLMLIIAPAGGGKTTLLLNIITRIYKNYWNKVYIFSPTIHNDAKWDHVLEAQDVLLPMSKTLRKIPISKHKNLKNNKQDDVAHKTLQKWQKNHIWNPFSIGTGHFDRKNRGKNYEAQEVDIDSESDEEDIDELAEEERRTQRIANMLGKPPPTILKQKSDYYNRHVLDFNQPCASEETSDKRVIEKLFMPTSSSSKSEVNHEVNPKKAKKNQVQPEDCFEEYSEATLNQKMKEQDDIVEACKQMKVDLPTTVPRICWVFDDMVGSGLFNQKRDNAFKRLTVRRRHFYSSLIGVTQAYKEIPKTTRTNANCLILFKIDSDKEIQMIYEEYPMGLKFPQWMAVYKYCTSEPYSFMLINNQTNNPDHKICKNFNQPISQTAIQFISHSESLTPSKQSMGLQLSKGSNPINRSIGTSSGKASAPKG